MDTRLKLIAIVYLTRTLVYIIIRTRRSNLIVPPEFHTLSKEDIYCSCVESLYMFFQFDNCLFIKSSNNEIKYFSNKIQYDVDHSICF